MKIKKIRIAIYAGLFILMIVLLIAGIAIVSVLIDDSCEFSTSNIDDYSTINHVGLPLFPSTIPSNAKISYSYYNYYNEDHDELLVLTFSNDEELNSFVDAIFAQIIPDHLYQRTNPYNNSYIEYLYTEVYAVQYQSKIQYLEHHSTDRINAHFHSINISYADHTVVIAYSSGMFQPAYVPAYIQYFDVAVDESLKDIVDLTDLTMGN